MSRLYFQNLVPVLSKNIRITTHVCMLLILIMTSSEFSAMDKMNEGTNVTTDAVPVIRVIGASPRPSSSSIPGVMGAIVLASFTITTAYLDLL